MIPSTVTLEKNSNFKNSINGNGSIFNKIATFETICQRNRGVLHLSDGNPGESRTEEYEAEFRYRDEGGGGSFRMPNNRAEYKSFFLHFGTPRPFYKTFAFV